MSVRNFIGLGVTAIALVLAFSLVDLRAVADAATHLPFLTLVTVLMALLSGALLASARLACIARDVGYPMRASDAIAALSLGQLGGALFFQVVGQLIARGAVLSRRGVPVAGTVLVTGYERVIALVVSVGFAVAGGWFLFGKFTLDLDAGGAALLKLVAGGLIAAGLSAALAWGQPFSSFARSKMGPRAPWRIVRNILLSVAIQVCTMTAYIAAVLGLSPGIALPDVAAAAAVVMLAAAVPISLAGWGMRELGAIYALGVIGLPREAALVAAVLIGAVALGVVALLALLAALLPVRPNVRPATDALPTVLDHGAMLAWSLPIVAAIAVLFQIHVPLATGRLNVNLADPIAIIGGVLCVLAWWRARQLPTWRMSGVNLHVLAATLILCVALLIGWDRYGWTSWALVNRFAGWFILLAYAATGALIVAHAGLHGFKLMLQTFAAAGVGIALLDLLIFAAIVANYDVPMEMISYRSIGFAQNPNAFALQLLLAFAGVIIASEGRIKTVLLTGVLIGLWFTGSRSGQIALCVVTPVALWLRAIRPRELVVPLITTAVVLCLINWLPHILGVIDYCRQLAVTFVASIMGGGGAAEQTPALAIEYRQFSPFEVIASGYEGSNVQRIDSLRGGWAMFELHPIFGGGLGAFIEEYTRAKGTPLAIHSTPLWVLAELGVVGLFVFAAPFVRMLKYEVYQSPARDPIRTFIILALLVFAVIGAVHDIMYQRAFWLLIGAALALPAFGLTRRQ